MHHQLLYANRQPSRVHRNYIMQSAGLISFSSTVVLDLQHMMCPIV